MHGGWKAAVVATPVALASAAVLLWRRALGPLPRWRREQTRLRRQLVLEDDLDWELPAVPPGRELRLVAGVDVSFFSSEAAATTTEQRAIATVVVLSFPALEVVYTAHQEVVLSTPYVAGFLAFREAAPLAALLRRLQTKHPQLAPQVVLVDGSGVLHPAGFGLACHLGVLTGLPTVGVAKNLLYVDGLDREHVRAAFAQLDDADEAPARTVPLLGASGRLWGMALRGAPGRSARPVFVSSGHRISLATAVAVTKACSVHRTPEPIRQADLRSRARIRQAEASEAE